MNTRNGGPNEIRITIGRVFIMVVIVWPMVIPLSRFVTIRKPRNPLIHKMDKINQTRANPSCQFIIVLSLSSNS